MENWTLILGVVGTILGIFNFYRSFRQDQVRLKVVPEYVSREVAVQGGGVKEKELFHVTVVNLSNFPVTINEVGVVARKQAYPADCLAKPGSAAPGQWESLTNMVDAALKARMVNSISDAPIAQNHEEKS